MERESKDNSQIAFFFSVVSSAAFWLCVGAVVYGLTLADAGSGKMMASVASFGAAIFGGLRGFMKMAEEI